MTIFQKVYFKNMNLTEIGMYHAIERMLWGFFKKLVVADELSVAINTLSADTCFALLDICVYFNVLYISIICRFYRWD